MSNIIDINRNEKIKTIPTLTKGELPPLNYYIESTHKDKSDKSNKCYKENDLTINM